MNIYTFLTAIGLLTTTVATAQGTLNNGLLAYYPFTGNTQDASGNNRHLTNSGAVLTENASGLPNSAYEFNGFSSYMTLGANAGISFTGDFTICMKVKPTGYFTGPCHGNALLTKGTDLYGSNNVGVLFDDGGYTGGANCSRSVVDTLHQSFYVHKLHQGTVATTCNLVNPVTPYATSNIWRCLVMMQKADTLYQYIDGFLVNQVYSQSFTASNNLDIFLGKTDNSSNMYYFKGVMDELRFYDRALTSNEVKDYCVYIPYAEENPTAVNAASKDLTAITLAPNPVGNLLTIRNPSNQPVRFTILDLQGRNILSGIAQPGANTLSTLQLESGLYLLQMHQNGFTETRRFLKN